MLKYLPPQANFCRCGYGGRRNRMREDAASESLVLPERGDSFSESLLLRGTRNERTTSKNKTAARVRNTQVLGPKTLLRSDRWRPRPLTAIYNPEFNKKYLVHGCYGYNSDGNTNRFSRSSSNNRRRPHNVKKLVVGSRNPKRRKNSRFLISQSVSRSTADCRLTPT